MAIDYETGETHDDSSQYTTKEREQMQKEADAQAGGAWIRRRRESMGLTQREVDAKTGGAVSFPNISLMEKGLTTRPSLYSLTALGLVLGFTPNEAAVAYGYLERDPAKRAVPEEVAFLLSVLERVGPGQRRALLLGVKNMAQLSEREG